MGMSQSTPTGMLRCEILAISDIKMRPRGRIFLVLQMLSPFGNRYRVNLKVNITRFCWQLLKVSK